MYAFTSSSMSWSHNLLSFLIFFGKSFMCSPPFYDLIIAYTYVYAKQNMYIYKFLHLRIPAGAFIMPWQEVVIMPRPRSPNRDKALQLWLDSGRKRQLKDIAAELQVSEEQIRKWKNQDKWDKVTLLIIKELLRVIKMLLAMGLQNRIRTQKNTVSSASTCLRRPFPLSRRCPRTRLTSYGTRCR